MKLISLNIWGGCVRNPFLDFISAYRDVDVFCLQEVYHNAPQKNSTDDRDVSLNIFSDIQQLLPNHHGVFKPVVQGVYGNAIFVNKAIAVLDEGEVPIFHNPRYPDIGPKHNRILQWVRCDKGDSPFLIANVHGLWNGLGKADTPDRIVQSEKIKNFMDAVKGPKVLCGDFNLRPTTKSVAMVAEGMRNLIDDYQVTSTRTSLYTKEEPFADYVFTSQGVRVNTFEVLKDEVSDHAPLLLDFAVVPDKADANTPAMQQKSAFAVEPLVLVESEYP